MPGILIDAPVIAPQASTAQPAAAASDNSANEGQSFKSALDKEMSNQAPENRTETKPGKSDKAEDGKIKDTGSSHADADSGITQPDLAALQIPLANTVPAKLTDPARGDAQEPIDAPRTKQGMSIDLKSATRQGVAGGGAAIQPKDFLRPGLNIKDGGNVETAPGKYADGRDGKTSPPAMLTPDQKGMAHDPKQVVQTGHDKLSTHHDDADALPKTAEQPNTLETVRNDSPSILSPDIRPAANQSLAPVHVQFLQPQTAARIDAQIATGAWNNALGQQIVMMATDKQQQAEIHLNPPEMGPIKVTLSLDNNQASLSFLVHQTATREAIESALPRLNEMMSASGITLGQTNVQADTSGSFHQTGQYVHTSGTDLNQPGSDGVKPQVQATARAISREGLVDTFA